MSIFNSSNANLKPTVKLTPPDGLAFDLRSYAGKIGYWETTFGQYSAAKPQVLQHCPYCRRYEMTVLVGNYQRSAKSSVFLNMLNTSAVTSYPYDEDRGPPEEEYRCIAGHTFRLPIEPARAPRLAPAS